MYILSKYEELLCKEIVDCAYKVHKQLGPCLLKKIYEACFCYELAKKEIPYKRQVDLPFSYDELQFNEGLRLDVYVDEKIICEMKAVNEVNPIWQAQLNQPFKTYRKQCGLHY